MKREEKSQREKDGQRKIMCERDGMVHWKKISGLCVRMRER